MLLQSKRDPRRANYWPSVGMTTKTETKNKNQLQHQQLKPKLGAGASRLVRAVGTPSAPMPTNYKPNSERRRLASGGRSHARRRFVLRSPLASLECGGSAAAFPKAARGA